jgi:hypothetical protein
VIRPSGSNRDGVTKTIEFNYRGVAGLSVIVILLILFFGISTGGL